MGDIYVAKNGFACTSDGARLIVYAGDTVEAGHPLLASNPDSFAPIKVRYPAPAKAAKAAAKGE